MIRENWRILLLVVFVVGAAVALFAPVGGGNAGPTAASGPTNLQFGLQLSGGTQIRAPLSGLTAQNVSTSSSQRNLSGQVATQLGVSPADVRVTPHRNSATVEEFSGNVTKREFASALQQAGSDVSPNDIQNGVTRQTDEDAVRVLENKISESGLTGGSVQIVSSGSQRYIQIEVPNQNRSSVRNLVASQGRVQTVAYFPVHGGQKPSYCEQPPKALNGTGGSNASNMCYTTVLGSQNAFRSIGSVQRDQRTGEPIVPTTLTDNAAQSFTRQMQRYGFADSANASSGAVSACQYRSGGGGHCLLTVRDGRVVYAAGVTQGLAQQFATGSFANNPSYQTSAPNVSAANGLQVDLQAGALPAPLDLQAGTSQYILPSVAQQFKGLSLVTGIIAVLAVATSVGIRYREPRVAVPMVLTALCEVFILLGFSAAIGLALDLSNIAGFIAVIGTGVDDLVIIADEIQRTEIKTGRVFQSRFRSAFWVIGAAAATTIIAMSPLAVLSLGDLQGFAIVTIVGVLIGVLITRPAYGNILRVLLTDS